MGILFYLFIQPNKKMLLSITANMFSEGLLDFKQRGIMKELILDQNPILNKLISTYQLDSDVNLLYKNILDILNL